MTHQCTRVWQDKRLLYFSDRVEPEFWETHWNGLISRDYYLRYESGELDELAPYAEKVFRRDDRILEAGCGSARMVVSLLARGFKNVEGIDCGTQTIARVREIFPNLPVRSGDALRIDRQDDYYDGYISMGVVEHRREGPEPYLKEAYRVLRPGARAFFSVPFINPLRSVKHMLGAFRKKRGRTAVFYQYAFSKAEFARILAGAGFEVNATRGVAGYYALQQELPLLFRALRGIRGGWRILRYLKTRPWVDCFGHMILFVCRKPRLGGVRGRNR